METKSSNEIIFDVNSITEPENIEDVIYSLMINPNLSNMNYFNDFSESTISPDSYRDEDREDLNVIELEASGTKMVMGTHAFHHHLQSDPQKATEILVSRAVRRMICLGVTPVAVSAFLYHIDYSDPNGQLITSGAKTGLENAAKAFNLKILERKVRFDYYTNHGPVPATLIVSMIGRLDCDRQFVTHALKKKGNNIFVIGDSSNDIGSSEYLEFYHGISESSLPDFDIVNEVKIQNAVAELNKRKLLSGASPIGKGGLFFTLLRAAIPNEFGFDITTAAEVRMDSFLFGEAMGRILVDVNKENEDNFVDFLTDNDIPFFTLGHVTKGEIRIDDKSLGFIDKMTTGI